MVTSNLALNYKVTFGWKQASRDNSSLLLTNGDTHRQETDANTLDTTEEDERKKTIRKGGSDRGNQVNDASNTDSVSSSDHVAQNSSEERLNKGDQSEKEIWVK